MTERVYLRPGDADAECEVHDWPTEGLAKRLVLAMRAKHRAGGVNVCRPCIDRAWVEARSHLTDEEAAHVDMRLRQ